MNPVVVYAVNAVLTAAIFAAAGALLRRVLDEHREGKP